MSGALLPLPQKPTKTETSKSHANEEQTNAELLSELQDEEHEQFSDADTVDSDDERSVAGSISGNESESDDDMEDDH